jgi:hypothetical protein
MANCGYCKAEIPYEGAIHRCTGEVAGLIMDDEGWSGSCPTCGSFYAPALREEVARTGETNKALLEGLKCVADFAAMPPRVNHDAGNGKEEIDKLIAEIALDLLRRVEYRIRRAKEA